MFALQHELCVCASCRYLQLLTKDPLKRLGSGPRDSQEIKAHPFFRGVDFDQLTQCRIAPPWRPAVASSIDTSQFDQEFTNLPLHSPPSRVRGCAPMNSDNVAALGCLASDRFLFIHCSRLTCFGICGLSFLGETKALVRHSCRVLRVPS